MVYQRDNIIFKIASSDCISKFKVAQALALLEIARPSVSFSQAAQDVVMLHYDRFSNWLNRTERLCRGDANEVTQALLDTVVGSCYDEVKVISSVMDEYPESFDQALRAYVCFINRYAIELVETYLKENIVGLQLERAFCKIVDIVILYLQHLVIALFERNSLTFKKAPFLCVSEFSLAFDKRGLMPVAQRGCYLMKEFDVRSFTLKNYCSMEDGYVEELIKICSEKGFSIVPESVEEAQSRSQENGVIQGD